MDEKSEIIKTQIEKLLNSPLTEESFTSYLYQLSNPYISEEVQAHFSTLALNHFKSLIDTYTSEQLIPIIFENQAFEFLHTYCVEKNLNEEDILYADLFSLLTNPVKRKAYHAFNVFQSQIDKEKELSEEERLEKLILSTLEKQKEQTEKEQVIALLKELKKECKQYFNKKEPFYFSHELSLFSLAKAFDFYELNPIQALRKTLYHAYKDCAIVSEASEKELQKILSQYGIKSIILRTEEDIEDNIKNLYKYIHTVKEVFNLNDSEVGEALLHINLVQPEDANSIKEYVKSNHKLGDLGGGYDDKVQTLVVFDNCNQEESLVTFLHEYTHFRQLIANFNQTVKKEFNLIYDDVFFKPTPEKMKEHLDRTVDFLKKFTTDTTSIKDYLIKEMETNDHSFFHAIKRKKEIKEILLLSMVDVQEVKQNWEVLYTVINNNLLKHNTNHSFEQNIWKQRDKKIKMKYWLEPIEIHARINTELYNKHHLHSTSINDKDFSTTTLERLESKIPKFNELCIQTYRDMKMLKQTPKKFNV
jgi:hypothetical protein